MKNRTLELMAEIVEKKVKHYKSDFYEHDTKSIMENEAGKFIWIVRECGTWIFKDEEISNTYSYYLEDKNVDFYSVDTTTATVKKIPFNKREHLKHFRAIYKCSNNVFLQRKMEIDARDKQAAEKLAEKWMPEGYEYFEIYAA